MTNTIVKVDKLEQKFNLTKSFFESIKFKGGKVKRTQKVVNAVNGISFHVDKGEVFSLVGESGCGKSTTAKTIIKLIEPKAGSIVFNGEDITNYSYKQMLPIRKDIQLIFQDPYASLNPRQKISDIIMEPLEFHNVVSNKKEALERINYLLDKVGIRPDYSSRYPHQFSGGQRQRIGIARAISVNPKLIIADEPVSALDVSVQAQILNLMMDLKEELGLSYLFIAHDLSVVRHISDRVGIMYLGYLVEVGDKKSIFENPNHPYTRALFSAIPKIDANEEEQVVELHGEIPDAINLPFGCPFHTRCPYAKGICKEIIPELKNIDDKHKVACHII